MDPMTPYRCIAAGANNNRTCLAGTMPAPPTPVSAIAAERLSVSPGDYVVKWDDDHSLFAVAAAVFATDFEAIV
ncbi:MAG TPA: hypothetical protein VFO62_10435 [Candidatus Binatia bacterium]|nr:hypothetical protein [Candidatus Binatia bacterium]